MEKTITETQFNDFARSATKEFAEEKEALIEKLNNIDGYLAALYAMEKFFFADEPTPEEPTEEPTEVPVVEPTTDPTTDPTGAEGSK